MNNNILNPFEQLESIWRVFFPNDKFDPQDKRLGAVSMFTDFFNDAGKLIVEVGDLKLNSNLILDVCKLSEALPFSDFQTTLRNQPNEVIGCVVSVIA